MRNSDKASFWLSVIALVASAVSPFATYYWLQDALREQSLKAQSLRATGRHSLEINRAHPDQSRYRYSVTVLNSGPLPVDGVALTFRRDDGFPGLEPEPVRFTPPVGAAVDISEDTLSVSFRRPLPPSEEISFNFAITTGRVTDDQKVRHPDGWIMSTTSPAVPISWRSGGVSI